jgi:hypothetical protein
MKVKAFIVKVMYHGRWTAYATYWNYQEACMASSWVRRSGEDAQVFEEEVDY